MEEDRSTNPRKETLSIRTTLTVLSAAAVLGLTSCSSNSTAESPDVPDTPADARSEASSIVVENPLDLKAVSDPCQLLTPEQLAQLENPTEAEPTELEWGEKGCSWYGEQYGLELSPNTVSGGFATIRQNQKSFDNYQEVEVAGYQAARTDATDISCSLWVAVSDDSTLGVQVGKYDAYDDLPQPCELAEKIFPEVVKNIPPQD